MAIVRAHVNWGVGGPIPKNDILNVPHFNIAGLSGLVDTDWQDFADGLCDAVSDWQSANAQAKDLTVTLYDAEAEAPNYPKAIATKVTGNNTIANWPRELAVCLSFYSEHNRPRQRGRLYLCPGLMFNSNGLDTRPTDAIMEKMMDFGAVLEAVGGVNVDWCIWSRVDRKARKVTDYWVDDEWDVQRRRGLISTKRMTHHTNE